LIDVSSYTRLMEKIPSCSESREICAKLQGGLFDTIRRSREGGCVSLFGEGTRSRLDVTSASERAGMER
jgi:hypothetical protein